MKIVTDISELPSGWRAPAVALGMFDGVHLGHRALLAAAVADARRRGTTAAVVTFDPHPVAVLAPERAPVRLTTISRQFELFADAGMDACVVLPFSEELAAMSAADFVDGILRRRLQLAHAVIGWNWTYGAGRQGTAATLADHGAREGFGCERVAAVAVGGDVVSSSRIREHLAAGEVRSAARLLGRNYDVDGTVVHGAKRGRTIGFPTANLALELSTPLPLGIYATWVHVDGARLPSVTSLGKNPTFVEGGPPTFEVHVLDWCGDLYGRGVRVELVDWIRGEQRFASAQALVAQIHEDVVHTRRALACGGV